MGMEIDSPLSPPLKEWSGNRTMIDGGHCGRGRGEGRTEEERRRQQWVLAVVKFGVLRYIYEVRYRSFGYTELSFVTEARGALMAPL